ncbi:M48 family metalloprotease [Dechloromonas sp. CZR5]|uniref:M48 family metalloprotease n=1 Tax=Dechloromonas sp. CZR5 TaxID=2608630 RepID=UPI00123CD03D|nr:M48 family metalloprotease [Dechloromonas sp. CZR5]
MKIAPRFSNTSPAVIRDGRLAVATVLAALFLGACSNTGSTSAVSATNAEGLITAGKSAVQAATLSDADVMQLSEKSCAELDGKSKIAAPKSKYALRLARIVKNMPKAAEGVTINYKVYETKEVNAWAMNNGCVRVYSGLMDLMNDDEVRGVVGHEIGHVALGHSKKSMQVAYAAGAARQAAAASGNSAVAALSSSDIGAIAEKLVNAQFSQAQETDADDYSFDLLTAAKLKREGLITAFEKLAKLGDSSSMLSSHPSSSGRAQHIRDRIAAKK